MTSSKKGNSYHLQENYVAYQNNEKTSKLLLSKGLFSRNTFFVLEISSNGLFVVVLKIVLNKKVFFLTNFFYHNSFITLG